MKLTNRIRPEVWNKLKVPPRRRRQPTRPPASDWVFVGAVTVIAGLVLLIIWLAA